MSAFAPPITFSQRVAVAAIVFYVFGGGVGCEHHDIGDPCPQLLKDQNPVETGPTTADTQEVVEQNPLFPCEELLCIATAGRPGYCSRKCREDAGCPEGFVCRVIQNIGPFAGEKFCAWKPCRKRKDCGTAEDFCCSKVAGADRAEELRLCEFSNDGKCTP